MLKRLYEEDYKKKWCPLTFFLGRDKYHRCLTTSCALWDGIAVRVRQEDGSVKLKEYGRCALGGRN